VVSDKADTPVIVAVSRQFIHPLYKKYIKRTKRFAAHDAENRCKVGDFVRIAECRPMSRTKRWEVLGGPSESGAGGVTKGQAATADSGASAGAAAAGAGVSAGAAAADAAVSAE